MRAILILLFTLITSDAFAGGAIAAGEANGRPVAAIRFNWNISDAGTEAFAACKARGVTWCHTSQFFADRCAAFAVMYRDSHTAIAFGSDDQETRTAAIKACSVKGPGQCYIDAARCDTSAPSLVPATLWTDFVGLFNPIKIDFFMPAEGVATVVVVGTIGIILILAVRYIPRWRRTPERQWHSERIPAARPYRPPPPMRETTPPPQPSIKALAAAPLPPEPPSQPAPLTADEQAKEAMRQAIMGNRAKAKEHQEEARETRGKTFEI